MLGGAFPLLRLIGGAAKDLAPIVLIVFFFQIVVLKQNIPNLLELLIGLSLVMIGLAVFIQGLEMALFPIGGSLADALARKGSLMWLMLFSFGLGFGTTVAEPALIAVTDEAASIMARAGKIPAGETSESRYAIALRYTVAVAVGASIMLGVFRILKGWPVQWLIVTGYIIVIVLTPAAPPEIVGIAYDSGGVTTSTITVPIVTALGIGLASVIGGRNPMIDGFGLIAFASLVPIIFVLIFGTVIQL
jgi:hypothetical protein